MAARPEINVLIKVINEAQQTLRLEVRVNAGKIERIKRSAVMEVAG